MHLFKTSYSWAALAAILATAAPAYAQLQPSTGIEPKLLDRTGRFQAYTIPQVRTLAAQTGVLCTATSTALTTVPAVISTTLKANVAGYMVSSAGSASLTGWTVTTSIAPMEYFGKVQVLIADVSGDTTPACRYAEICGDLWNGSSKCEYHNGINTGTTQVGETTWLTSDYGWSRLTRVRVAECTSTDADDVLLVRQTPNISLPRRLSQTPGTTDVLSVCASNFVGSAAGSIRCVSPSLLSFDTDLEANSVNILDADFRMGAGLTSCPPENSPIQVNYRASPVARTY